MAESHQLTLLGITPRPLPREETGLTLEVPDPIATSVEPASGQIDLFAERACLARDLEGALRGGDFDEASRLRRLFEETYGASPETSALSFLEGQADALSSAPPEEALPVWRRLDSSLGENPRLRRLLQEGALRRLLRSHSAADLAAASPASLPAIALAVASGLAASPEDGQWEARRLIRDALLAGLRPEPLEFRWDPPLEDLLAEDEEPPWLASLGVIRRLWPAPRPTEEDVDALSRPFVEPAPGDQAALAFWSCLRSAEDRDCPERALQEARRRMKRLRPEFHAVHMRRVRN